MSGIKDKVVVTTAARCGATAVMLAERVAKVVLGARGLDRREELTSLVKLACDRYGQLDVLVAEFTDCPNCLPIVNAPP
jgi:hypothetical protein